MSKKDLLRCEIQINPSELAITKLLNPKPKFEYFQSSMLQKMQNFLPEFKKANEQLQNTDNLKQLQINDQNALMRTNIKDLIPDPKIRRYIRRTGRQQKMINLDLYMGIMDTSKDFKE
ncbi:unnamed protein product [Paramecium pentaurelia]|uniref:Uncharacterized protein n=1 Tax=Paramecium pentaurelia TaxID=43138 RepID=A0A8S1TAT6_9CILI|nr:unnamed protein product [Paramecium pentaurelia]CAD8147752.1 unnamed protein product [Paramecium pentaurelia]